MITDKELSDFLYSKYEHKDKQQLLGILVQDRLDNHKSFVNCWYKMDKNTQA